MMPAPPWESQSNRCNRSCPRRSLPDQPISQAPTTHHCNQRRLLLIVHISSRLPFSVPDFFCGRIHAFHLSRHVQDSIMDNSSDKASRGRDILRRLRCETFNLETEEKLETHPFLRKAEEGKLSLRERQAFCLEQYKIQLSDAKSFAALAGHSDPNMVIGASLTRTKVPEPARNPPAGAPADLFQFLLGGEIYAAALLLKYAEHLNLDEAALASYKASAHAQAYPSYWARIALSNNRAAGAAACAINFPAWGRMCKRLAEALGNDSSYGYKNGVDDEALSFVKFFATPIENLDEMAIAIIEEEGSCYEDLLEPVRLLQQYEIMFWDALLSDDE